MSPLDGSPATPLPAALPPRPAFALGPDYLCASVSRTPFADPRHIATPARGETLAQLAERWLPDPVLRAHAVARVDGREIPAWAWDRVTPLAGSLVELAVRPGQRGKNPLATILQIALLAGALWISGGGLAGLLGTTSLFAAGSISAGLAAAAFTVAGSYLINAIAPPPDLGLNRAGGEVSPTYFINAARNQLRLGAPVPAIHGRHRMVPPLGGSYVREVRGDDLWLRGIVVWGIGPVEISDVRIGDTPFDQFAGTTIQHYPGDGTATPLSLYPNAPTELDVGATLSNAAGWIRRTTNANAEEISVDVDFPQGLARVNPKNGRLEARSVQLEVRWAPADASGEPAAAWQYSAPTPGQADAAAASQGGVRVGSGLFNFDYNEWQLALTATPTQWIHTRSERKPFRRSRRWAVARQPHGYVVEVRRVTPDTPDNDLEIVDTCVWSILRSVFMRAPVRDPWIAYSAFEIRASDQLNSVVDELNAVVERLYPDFDADGLKGSYGENGGLVGDWVKSRLPAHAVVDAMTGKGRQRPFGPDQMDFVFFDGWRQWCADNDRFFDHVVDYETTASRFIRTAMAAGQAGPLWRGAQLSGVIDAPRPVRRMLTARSMRRFSATVTFPGEIHGLSTEFLNEEQGWQLDEATVYVPGRGPENATRIERMPSPGKTRPEEVQEWLAFHLASMLLQSRERYEIETDLPAFAVQRGERQLVSHDVVRAGTGARVIDVETDSAGDVTAVLLDEEIDILADTDYGMRWREPVPDPESAEPGQMVWSIRDTAPVTAAAGRTARMVLVSPRPPQDAPFEGDEVVVGERFAEAEDVVVLGVLRGDDRASTLLAVPYGETRFSGDIVIPEFATSVQNPFKARPPRPRPAGAPYASDDGIAVPFTIETGATVPVARFIARWRRTPDGSETDGGFDALPNLASDERRVILPAGDPAQPYDLDLWSEDYDGRRSEPLELRALVASEYVPTPDLLDAQGGHDETEGAKLPALTVRWDPYTNPEIANLRIAIRNPGQGVDDFEEVATADPDAGEKTTRDVPRGRTVEVGARFRSRRGGFSQWAVWPDPVPIPAELVASDSLALDGLTRESVEASIAGNAAATEALEARQDDLETAQGEVEALQALLRDDVNRLALTAIPPGPRVGAATDILLTANQDGAGTSVPGSIRVQGEFLDPPTLDRWTNTATVIEANMGGSYVPPGGRFFIVWHNNAMATRYAGWTGAGGRFGTYIYAQAGQWFARDAAGVLYPANFGMHSTVIAVGVKLAAGGIASLRMTASPAGPIKSSVDQLGVRTDTAEVSISALQIVSADNVTRLDSVEFRTADVEAQAADLISITNSQATQLSSLTADFGTAQGAITSLQTLTADHTAQLDSLSFRADGLEADYASLVNLTGEQATRLTQLTIQSRSQRVGGDTAAGAGPFTSSTSGLPGSVTDLATSQFVWASTGTFGARLDTVGAGMHRMRTAGLLRLVPGRRYRLHALMQRSSNPNNGGTADWRLVMRRLDATGANQSSNTLVAVDSGIALAPVGAIEAEGYYTAVAGDAWGAPELRLNEGGGNGLLRVFELGGEDAEETEEIKSRTQVLETLTAQTALYEILAAAGDDPALIRLFAGPGGSVMEQAATVLRFISLVGGDPVEAMRLIAGNVHISNILYLGANRQIKLDPGDDQPLITIFYGDETPSIELGWLD